MNSNTKKVYILYFVILPLLFASFIYLFLRPIKPILLIKVLLYFNISSDYYFLLNNSNLFISFILYNLSDLIWAFSMTSFVLLNNLKDNNLKNKLYLFAALFLIFTQEFLQGKLLPGTFDWIDIFALATGCCSAFLLIQESKK